MRVVVVEDHVLFAESLAVALRLEGYDVRRPIVRPGTTSTALLDAILRAQPVVAILDLDLGPHLDGADLIGALAAAGIEVLVVTGARSRAQWGRCLHQGAQVVVAKQAPLAEVVAAVRRLTTGQRAMTPARRTELISAWRDEDRLAATTRQRFARLTPRERAVLDGLADGRRIHDIATSDVVSEATVRTQVKSILGKLGVRSQIEAVLMLHHHQPDRR